MIVIDTDVLIDMFRNHIPAVDFFNLLIEDYQQNEILFSTITTIELIAGSYCTNFGYRENTLHFLSNLNEVSISNKIAVLSGDIKREYHLTLPDAIIAATAITEDATLITRNIKDFERVKGLKLRRPY